MRCNCGFGDVRYAKVKHGKLTCPYCSGEICCESPLPTLRCSAEAYALIKPRIARRKQESFWVFYLDARNRIIGNFEVCKGTANYCVVHPRDVFGRAVTKGAIAIILVHNHPSGDISPSPEDEALTARLVEVGKILGIPVMDHLIIGREMYFSFKDAGVF